MEQKPFSGPRGGGFTLIELMITLLIVSILAAVAYPSYTEHVHKARRVDAQGALLQLAMVMERIYTEEGTYKPGGNWPTLGNGASDVFADKSPVEGSDAYYSLSMDRRTTDDGTNYLLSAAPVNVQQGDRCGTLTLGDNGVRDVQGQEAGVDADDCW